MLTIKEKVTKEAVKKLNILSEFYSEKELIMFDIETTGLSPANSIIYLIGYNYYENGDWYITLLFNDDGFSEPEIIQTFMDKLSNYRYLMHFNGDTFDINFVTKRLNYINDHTKYNIKNYFPTVQSIDLYKMIKPYKKSLGLPNVKQKTIEEFLGIRRIDMYNGGQLIDVYFDYLASKSEKLKDLLIQHNHDDMEGMFYLSSIFALDSLFNGKIKFHDFSVKQRSDGLRFIINLSMAHPLSVNLSMFKDKILINTFQDICTISVPICTDCKKLFFNNPEDYIYVEELDTAVPKTVKNDYLGYTISKAKKCNCYNTVDGYFAPCVSEIGNIHLYKEKYTDKAYFVRLSDDLLSDREILTKYCKDIIRFVMK